jgi:cell division control protein 6
VRALLRPTCNHNSLIAGRQSERDVITRFISGFTSLSSEDESTESADASILYISGSPGTGKTALVNAVVDETKVELDMAQVSVAAVNCMAVNDIDALYDRLGEELSKATLLGKKSSRSRKVKETSLQALSRLLSESDSKW